ncbi:MAG TPA: hypothetical protein VGO93_05575 [Candidatus Xenobia bacterium]|jgi:hypothetical protein
MPDYLSRPFDLENPTFDSLLDLLRAVYQGQMPPYALMVYYEALTKERDEQEAECRKLMGAHPDNPGPRLVFGALAVVRGSLEMLPRYVEEPTPPRMKACIDMLMEARRLTDAVRGYTGNPPTPDAG